MRDSQNASLEKRVENLEIQLAELRNMIVASKPTERRVTDDRENLVVTNIKNIGVQDAVVFCLHMKGPQAKEQIKNILDVWGMPYLSWFDGGNFNNRLLKKGVVKMDGVSPETNEPIYSLTMNGERIAEERLARLGEKEGVIKDVSF